jgi:hypothetical protein
LTLFINGGITSICKTLPFPDQNRTSPASV